MPSTIAKSFAVTALLLLIGPSNTASSQAPGNSGAARQGPVYYTHLTLPTIYSV